MSGSADVTSGVQKKYLTIKSADFNVDTKPEDYVYIDLEFPEPLQHVHEVALQTAIIPNEFFNVRDGQNSCTLGWITKNGLQTRVATVTVDPGLYTLDKLCDELTTQFAAAAITTELINPTNGITFSRENSTFASDYKLTKITDNVQTTLTTNDLSKQGYYVLVHVATEQTPFATSIPARLGFTRNDIFTVYETPVVTGSVATANSVWTNRPASFTDAELANMLLRETSVFEDYVTQTVNDNNIALSMLPGTETYDAILLHCDLLSNSTLITGHLNVGTHPAPTTVFRSDILSVIPNTANIGGNIVFIRPSEHYGGHAINQHRPITKMRLWLSDTAGKPFRHYEMADWTAVLEFTIVEHVPDIMRQVAQLNQNKSFQSRHMPMTIG